MCRYGHTSDGAVTEADAELPGTMVVRAQGALSHMSTVLPSPKGMSCTHSCMRIARQIFSQCHSHIFGDFSRTFSPNLLHSVHARICGHAFFSQGHRIYRLCHGRGNPRGRLKCRRVADQQSSRNNYAFTERALQHTRVRISHILGPNGIDAYQCDAYQPWISALPGRL
jgi:hypothetical protein